MKNEAFTCRRMIPEDAGSYRLIRLQALTDDPAAFGATLEEEQRNNEEVFRQRLSRLPIFGAFVEDQIVGMVGLYQDEQVRLSHKSVLWGFFVRQENRSFGIGARLLGMALAEAESRSQQVTLAVSIASASAIALYERNGFERYGIEPRAIKGPDGYLDEVLMVRFRA